MGKCCHEIEQNGNKIFHHKFLKYIIKQLELWKKITRRGDSQISGGNEIGINRYRGGKKKGEEEKENHPDVKTKPEREQGKGMLWGAH